MCWDDRERRVGLVGWLVGWVCVCAIKERDNCYDEVRVL